MPSCRPVLRQRLDVVAEILVAGAEALTIAVMILMRSLGERRRLSAAQKSTTSRLAEQVYRTHSGRS
jgi:hypothetical protein